MLLSLPHVANESDFVCHEALLLDFRFLHLSQNVYFAVLLYKTDYAFYSYVALRRIILFLLQQSVHLYLYTNVYQFAVSRQLVLIFMFVLAPWMYISETVRKRKFKAVKQKYFLERKWAYGSCQKIFRTSATDVSPTSANVMLPLYLGTSGAAVNANVGPT